MSVRYPEQFCNVLISKILHDNHVIGLELLHICLACGLEPHDMIWIWMVWWLFTEDKVTLPILNTLSKTTDHENKSTNAANKAIAEKNRIKRMKGITTTTTIATAILIWTRMVWWLFNQDKVIGQSKQSRGSGQTVFNRSMVFIFVIVVTKSLYFTIFLCSLDVRNIDDIDDQCRLQRSQYKGERSSCWVTN